MSAAPQLWEDDDGGICFIQLLWRFRQSWLGITRMQKQEKRAQTQLQHLGHGMSSMEVLKARLDGIWSNLV